MLYFQKGITSPFYHFTISHDVFSKTYPVYGQAKWGIVTARLTLSEGWGELWTWSFSTHEEASVHKDRSRVIWRGWQGPFPLSALTDPGDSRFLCKTKAIGRQIRTKTAPGWVLWQGSQNLRTSEEQSKLQAVPETAAWGSQAAQQAGTALHCSMQKHLFFPTRHLKEHKTPEGLPTQGNQESPFITVVLTQCTWRSVSPTCLCPSLLDPSSAIPHTGCCRNKYIGITLGITAVWMLCALSEELQKSHWQDS